MDTLTGKITARVKVDGGKTGTFGDSAVPISISKAIDLTFGAGANQANTLYQATRTLTASTSESLDFNGGGLLNPFGEAIALSEIKALYIENTHATQDLTVGGATNIPGFVNTRTIGPGGFDLIVRPGASGIVVTATTADLLTFANGAGTSLIYKIWVLGN